MASISKESVEYSLLNEDPEDRPYSRPSVSKPRSGIAHWTVHIISALCIISLVAYHLNTYRDALRACALRHNTWSPALDLSDRTDELVFMGTFNNLTPFKGPPSENTTAAWGKIWDVNTVNLTAETMKKMGRSLDSIQYPEEYGGGYLAQVEGVHQMHCLYAIWRDHHLHYFPKDQDIKKNRPSFYERHYEHCLDIIRQRLMCTADPGLVTFRWVDDEEIPEPDFNTPHMCSSYDKLLEWNKANEAIVEVNDIKWKKPKNAVTLPTAP